MSVVHLRAGVQRNGRQVETEQSHVLHNQSIYANAIQFPNQFFRFGQFFIGKDCVEGHVNTGLVQMGMLHQGGNVFQGIAGGHTGSEARSTDIDGVGTVVDCRDATLQVLGWSQQFYLSLFNHCISLISYGVS